MGTHTVKNRLKNKNFQPFPLAPTQNPKDQIQNLLSVLISCMKFLFPSPISARISKQIIIKTGWFKMFIEAPSQALQIIFEMQSQRTSQKKEQWKKYIFFKLQNAFFARFFILTPFTLKPHTFLISY